MATHSVEKQVDGNGSTHSVEKQVDGNGSTHSVEKQVNGNRSTNAFLLHFTEILHVVTRISANKNISVVTTRSHYTESNASQPFKNNK